ncbi:MAG: hypothetical protein LBS00_03485, partial [Synergistaceae bacterium]|nr:hypothetical protein [Synergistaceae bacterium]
LRAVKERRFEPYIRESIGQTYSLFGTKGLFAYSKNPRNKLYVDANIEFHHKNSWQPLFFRSNKIEMKRQHVVIFETLSQIF